MGLLRDFWHFILANKTPGVADPTKRADADQVMANYRDLRNAVFFGKAEGVYATDNGSTPAECRIIPKTANGEVGLVDAGDAVLITDGAGRFWRVDSATANDDLRFGPANQIMGVAMGAGYDVPAFIDSLRFAYGWWWVKVGKSDVVRTGTHAEKLTANDLQIGAGAAPTDPAGLTLSDLKAAFLTKHTAAGDHVAGAIDKAHLAEAMFQDQSVANLIKNGGMEVAPSTLFTGFTGTAAPTPTGEAPDGWEAYGAATIQQSQGQVYRGKYSLDVTGLLTNEGARGSMVEEFDVTQYRGKAIVLSAMVYCPDDNCAKIGLDVAAGPVWGTAGGAAGAWVKLTFPYTVGVAETALRPLGALAIDGNRTLYFDDFQITEGTVAYHYAPSAWDQETRRAKATGLRNYVINKDFLYWSNGAAAAPDGWVLDAIGSTVAQDNVNFVTAGVSPALTLVNAGIFQQFLCYLPSGLGYFNIFGDQYVVLTFWLMKVAGAGRVWARIFTFAPGPGAVQALLPFNPGIGVWSRYYLVLRCAAGMTQGYVSFENLDGLGNIQFNVDRVEFYPSPSPLAIELPDFFRLETITWGCQDSGGVGQMFHQGQQLGLYSGRNRIAFALHVNQSANSNAGGNTYAITNTGGILSTPATVAGGASTGSGHTNLPPGVGYYIPQGSLYDVQVITYNGYVGMPPASILAEATFLVYD